MTEPLISAENLSIIRRGKRILKDISLSVSAGEFVTIIGPNGAGKTVLLHTLMGLIKPDKGSVTRKHGLKIGYMPQRFTPETTMPITVARFLALVRGVDKNAIDNALELVNAVDVAQRSLSVLSGGELQRVMLARALLHKPDILILDEPTQGLDVGGQLSFHKLLENVYSSLGCAVVMVSHDLHLVLASTGKVVCLFHHICCSGKPSAVAKDPQFTSLFGEDMTRMMAVYQHNHTREHEHEY
ncbi:MAG: ATP-binding cassette domain-containing protein [Alphaproteobacteria bacterium]|nr:ATP-binding cassette domain-containing protein [Alphaproteobacteria bacterium]